MNLLANRRRYPLPALAVSTLLLLQACNSVTDSAEPADTGVAPTIASAPEPATTAPEEEAIEYGSFTEDQLYKAIVSELGAQRGQLADASVNYLQLAHETRDPTIIRRAIQFASAQNDDAALLELGLLWVDVAPGDSDPHLLVSLQLLEAGRLDQALAHMEDVIALGGEFDFTTLSARSAQANPQLQAAVRQSLQRLSQRYPEESSIRLALVQMLGRAQQYEPALEELRLYEEATRYDANTAALRAQLQVGLNRREAALRTLREAVGDFKNDAGLRLTYARLLIQNGQFEQATEQFEIMVAQNPEDYESAYSMALLNIEMEAYEAAIEQLQNLVAVDQKFDEAQYYLGFSHERLGQFEQAIEHFRAVRTGTNNFLAAQQQATRISIEQGDLDGASAWLSRLSRGQPRLEVLFTTVESNLLIIAGHEDKAEQLLNRRLNKYPNDVELLFARVLLWDRQGNQANSEQDLKQIIAMKPDDSRALNHLGYMLADQTERYEEALELIERAIAISPDDPAIIDSLAWAQYKLGRYEEALANLRQAYVAFPDPEVASHLGEVLWAMGREEEANRVWNDALAARPDSELLKEVIARFKPSS